MANLSQNNHKSIAEYFLNNFLNYLQNLFQKTKKFCDATDDNSDQKFQKSILKFFNNLFLL